MEIPDMPTLTSDDDRSTQESSVHSKLKTALYKRELLKINCMLNDHLSLRTVKLEDIQNLIHRLFKDSKGIQLQQPLIIDILRLLHKKGANLNEKDGKDRTVLQLSVERRLTQVIDFLISCNVNLYDSSGNSILHFLITNETSMFAKELHRKKKVLSQSYLTPVKKQSTDFINWMLLKGFNLDCQNNDGDTAVHLAAKYNLLHALPLLLEHSKSVAISNKCGMNAFQIMLHSVSIFANPQVKKVNGRNPGMFIPTNCYESSFIDEIYKMFASKGFPIDVADRYGCTPIHYMLMQDRPKLTKVMLDYFTNVNARDTKGNTVLHIVMSNIKDRRRTCADYHEIARILVSNGANVNQMNNYGMSPLVAAIVDHKDTLLKVFIENGIKLVRQDGSRSLLHHICKSKIQMNGESCREAIKMLTNQGCDVNSQDFRGKTPLHYAVVHGRTKIVEALIECGAKVNVKEFSMGFTPLHEAVKCGHEEILTVLVKNGADINATTDRGETVLYLAKTSKKNLTDTLIKLGASEDDNSQKSMLRGGYLLMNKLFTFCNDYNDTFQIRALKNNAPTRENLGEILEETTILKSCKDNPRKSLYYLMHINRNDKYSLLEKNKNIEQLIKTSNVKNWLSKIWDAKGKTSPRLSKKVHYANV